jgi:hypothetical protein
MVLPSEERRTSSILFVVVAETVCDHEVVVAVDCIVEELSKPTAAWANDGTAKRNQRKIPKRKSFFMPRCMPFYFITEVKG